MIVTLPDGRQVGIFTAADIADDNTRVVVRSRPGDCWSADLPVDVPHDPANAPSVHFGSW
jgi:hypothetical protein